ncbi:glycosyltransferase involved in cell wall biosynthesis [Paenibacillus cellulosilyticus]|uniref:Glycosyltransferase involved in cell wall biosynthesis n=1 Tax=Paenibacillus cellulosilyticus TaxID=375489 RepID=A0A2V2YU31_9BACL|nr:glycosyltransferase family 2 protein [Paenibacillus cellulosilyticus]PWW02767.1 glycosyltransferase involved in cell wall biosynthesis [Paenibacillus cellulosilyticus]QKS45690.1 glycosyltransferase family 2 protein [Paenibacillus cellulosilyticus]
MLANNQEEAKITVLMPVYNRADYIPFAIQSVLAQSYAGWRLIILDDASTDHTYEAANPFLTDSKIQYMRFTTNRGTGAVLADALSFIQTPYFVILDSDDWLDMRALEVLLREMENQDESIGLVFGNSVSWRENEGRIQIRSVEKHRSFANKYDFMLYHPMIQPRFFRTAAVREVGGFELDDPHQGRYMEDRYILLKLIGKYQFHYVNANLYHLRLHASNISNKKNSTKFEETRLYVYPKILKQWGDEYEPIFEASSGSGWLHLSTLLPRTTDLPVLKADRTAKNDNLSNFSEDKVTVVLPTYNRASYISEAIQSVLDQTLQDWQLLIIDDASTDQTEEIVAAYMNDCRISYVKRPVNGGIGSVLNDALKLVSTPYFMQLDADDWIEKDTISTLLQAMEDAGDSTALAYGNSVHHKIKKDGIKTEILQHRTFRDKYEVLLYRWMITPRFYRTNSVRAVGGWDMDVPFHARYAEDRQMFYKLAEHFKFLHMDRELYHSRIHGTNQSLSNREKYAEIRIYLVQYFFHKWRGAEQTNHRMEWHMNEQGWPQFRLVPIEQRKQKYLYILVAAERNGLAEQEKRKMTSFFKQISGTHYTVFVFTLDRVNNKGRYLRGIALEDWNNEPIKEEFLPFPDRIYTHDVLLYNKAKAWGSTVGCSVVFYSY